MWGPLHHASDAWERGDYVHTGLQAGVFALDVAGLKWAWRNPGRLPRGGVNAPKQAQINPRHKLNSNAIAKGKVNECTCAPPEILQKDLAAYNAGQFKKVANGNVQINGRIYCPKNEGMTLFPVEGAEFIHLTKGQIHAIKIIKQAPPDRLQDALRGAKISAEDVEFAKEFIKKY